MTDSQNNNNNSTSISGLILNFLSFIFAIPIFIFAHKNLPDPDWMFHCDRILIGFSAFILVRTLLSLIQKIVIFAFFVALAVLSYGSYNKTYGFVDFYKDAHETISKLNNSPKAQQIEEILLKPFRNSTKIENSIDYKNEKVRNFAVSSTRNFKEHIPKHHEYRILIQSFAIFKEIKQKWNYVSDPSSRDYFAKASESVEHFSGDCDDYAILMAASIKAIRGDVRLVRSKNHLYPELLIGNKEDLTAIDELIKNELFIDESKGKALNYHLNEQGQIWLNLDYTDKYPGAPFMSEDIVSILNLKTL